MITIRTLIDNKAVFRQIVACHGLLISADQVQKLWRLFSQRLNTGRVAEVECCHLAGNLQNNMCYFTETDAMC